MVCSDDMGAHALPPLRGDARVEMESYISFLTQPSELSNELLLAAKSAVADAEVEHRMLERCCRGLQSAIDQVITDALSPQEAVRLF